MPEVLLQNTYKDTDRSNADGSACNDLEHKAFQLDRIIWLHKNNSRKKDKDCRLKAAVLEILMIIPLYQQELPQHHPACPAPEP